MRRTGRTTVGLKRKVNGTWTPVTWREFAGQVRDIAAGFIAAGIQPGDRVGLMSRTRFEWTVLDYAILTAGGVTVPIYPTSSLEQVEWILGDSGAVAVVVETDDHAEKVATARAGLPALAHVWQIDGSRFGGLADIKARGAQVTPEQVEERRRTRGADDLAEIVYTSGTTGRPKGCMLSHGNIVANARNCMQNDGFKRVFNEHHSTLLFLPLSHSYAQVIQYGAIYSRTVLGLVDMADAVAELPAYKPTAVLSVPRLWEKAYNSAKHKADAEGHGKIFARAEATAIAYSQALDTGGPGLVLRLEHALFDRLVYGKLRAALGGAVQYSWSAAAPLGTRLGHFFRGCGINVLEGYGLTETSPATNSNTPEAQKIGTVGQADPRLHDPDRAGRRGPRQGPHGLPGLLEQRGRHQGDDRRGRLAAHRRHRRPRRRGVPHDHRAARRTSSSPSAGKNVAPAVLEDRLRAHWLISQCLVVGDAKPYIAVLVAADPETFAQWKADNGKPETATIADLRDDPASAGGDPGGRRRGQQGGVAGGGDQEVRRSSTRTSPRRAAS